jgi:hypothetical protein
VYQQLTKDGFTVNVVKNPALSVAGYVDEARRVTDVQTEPVPVGIGVAPVGALDRVLSLVGVRCAA